jgi:hypothetical protein
MDEGPATTGMGDRVWTSRWRQREAALRSLIAQWRQAPIVRRVFPDSRLDPMREQFAREVEAILDASDPVTPGGLPV